MRLLLDTNVFLWWIYGAALTPSARSAIAAPESDVRVSSVTVWESEIKRATGKLKLPDDLIEVVRVEGFAELPVRFEHAVAAGRLPRHHGDPFDRMLVAQAQLEGLSLVTADSAIARYDVHVVPAR